MTRIPHQSLRELGWTLLALGLTLAGCGVGDPQGRDIGEQVKVVPQSLRAITAGAMSFGTNLLIDPSFESRVALGDLPASPNNWRGDLCASVVAENGIAPHSGATMLKFQATGVVPSFSRLTARQWQLVDLRPFASAIAAGGVRANARGSLLQGIRNDLGIVASRCKEPALCANQDPDNRSNAQLGLSEFEP